jgi:hypothetical protein
MPRSRTPTQAVAPSKLRRALAEAEAILDKQIARGEAIATALRQGELPADANRWHDENAAILERLFTGPESTEYRNCIIVGPTISTDLDDDEIPWHHTRVEWLRSLRGRLYVYETVAPTAAVDAGDGQARAHRGEVTQAVIFISHISEEAPLAFVLKDWIESTFPNQCAVFVSSDPRDLPAGTRWLDEIEQTLAATRVLLVLSSPTSLTRPWINIETGCALMKRVPVVPICHSGQRRGGLPPPLSTFQAVEVESPTFVNDFFTGLAKQLKFAGVPRIDRAAMRADLERASGECASPDGGDPVDAVRSPETDALEEGALHLLRIIVENDDPGYTAADLAAACSLSTTRAKYYIDGLTERKLLTRSLFVNRPAEYNLSSAGRKYLADAGLL